MITVLPIQDSDIEAIAGLAEVIWYEHYPSIITREQIRYMLDAGYKPALITDELANGVRWDKALRGAGSDAKTVGFSAYEVIGNQVKLHKIYALSATRGTGVGRAMLARVVEFAAAQGCASVFLQVAKTNLDSVRFYQRLGFSIERAVVNGIGDGFVMDDYVMRKLISPD